MSKKPASIFTALIILCGVSYGDSPKSLKTEKLDGKGVFIMPILQRQRFVRPLPVKVWFEDQFLGDGKAYKRRSKEFAGWKRSELRAAVMTTLKELNKKSMASVQKQLDQLVKDEKISGVRPFWIVNGFACRVTAEGFEALKKIRGVRKIFMDMNAAGAARLARGTPSFFPPKPAAKFDPARHQHPWYSRYLLADKVWKEFGVAGQGTLNVVHDFNFVFPPNLQANLYHNAKEIPGNGKDDDGNGFIDDVHGYNFDSRSAVLNTTPVRGNSPRQLHGTMCAAIICGTANKGSPVELGIAPQARWAGVIGTRRLESAVQWAVEQGADTYSMSFSIPGLGHYRSHWRKVMEHGSFCGIFFVSGAGNFAQRVAVPVQMRTPEDIPEVVFAAAGVQRDFSRTPFSSKGPVRWDLEHYKDGTVQKPEVCAFNSNIPRILANGDAAPTGASGNSFAGPMFCGSIALMLSADKELLPWDLKEIITSTATDVGEKGVDAETGHGLINCYRAVKEVLRRKAKREGKDTQPFSGRSAGDVLDLEAVKKKLRTRRYRVVSVQADGQAARLGLKAGDIIVSYNGTPVASRIQMMRAKRLAERKKVNPIPVVILRDGKRMEFKFAPGQLGLQPSVEFDDPVFK